MEPSIQYTRTTDGVNIAYWTIGDGLPVIQVPRACSATLPAVSCTAEAACLAVSAALSAASLATVAACFAVSVAFWATS